MSHGIKSDIQNPKSEIKSLRWSGRLVGLAIGTQVEIGQPAPMSPPVFRVPGSGGGRGGIWGGGGEGLLPPAYAGGGKKRIRWSQRVGALSNTKGPCAAHRGSPFAGLVSHT